MTRAAQPAEEWLVIEWPEDEAEPTKYWLSTLPATIGFEALVDRIKLRWRIERDYQELKQEVGLGHYDGRGWRGLHHHLTLCVAAYGFLIAERATFPPSGPCQQATSKAPVVPDIKRSNGATAAPRTAYRELYCHAATPAYRRTHPATAALSMLRRRPAAEKSAELVTQ